MDHAVAVVDDADHPLAADFRLHANGLRPGVQRVFEQLFNDRSGTLDHFARSDFICDSFRQNPYSTHFLPNNQRAAVESRFADPPYTAKRSRDSRTRRNLKIRPGNQMAAEIKTN